MVSFPLMHNLNLTMRKHCTKPNWGTFDKTTDQCPSKVSRSWKNKVRFRNWQRLEMTKEIGKTKYVGSQTTKDTNGETGVFWKIAAL
jgi:hypothetical protein